MVLTTILWLPILHVKLLYFEWSPPRRFKTARLDFMSAWSGQVRADIQLISWNAFCYSQLRRLTGSNLLTFFLTNLLPFFLTYLLTYLLTFFLTYLLTFFLTYLLTFFLTFFLTYQLTCFLTYLLTFFLTYQRQNIASTASHKSNSTISIFTPHHAAKVISTTTLSVKWQFYSCIRLHRTAPPRSSWVQRCKAPVATHTPHAAMQVSTPPQLPLPLWLLPLFSVGGSAGHSIGLPLMHSNLPKGRQSSKDWSTLLQLLLALLMWNSPPFVRHIPQSSLQNLWLNEHTIASMRSARRLHAHVDALSTNRSQRVAPHMRSSFGKPAGRPNEDRRRTFHHKLRHGCQTKLTCLHTKKLSHEYLLQCATSNDTTLALLHFL